MIDSDYRVVRLKQGLTKQQPPEHFGTRTDVICGRSQVYCPDGIEFWFFPDDSPWVKYYSQFKPRPWKPSHGLSAVFCALDRVQPKAITLIGFDRILYPRDEYTGKWYDSRRFAKWQHDQRAENECLYSLGVEIIDLARANGEVS